MRLIYFFTNYIMTFACILLLYICIKSDMYLVINRNLLHADWNSYEKFETI